jgi:multiple sugar transport system substrate-binding protein
MFESSNIFPALIGAQEDPMMDREVAFFDGQKVYRHWIEAANKAPGVRVNRFDPVADELFGQAVSEVLQEGEDPETALNNANDQIRRRAR